MKKLKKLTMTLVALFAMTTGAWAGAETPLITIESTGDNASFTSGSQTFDNIATVTFSGGNVGNDGQDTGWFSGEECTLTVTAAEGYTITRVKFYNDSGSAFDEEAPFEAILVFDGGMITKVNGTSIGTYGVTKIEVYGYAAAPAGPEVTWNAATKTGTFAMPGYDVELEVAYFNITAPTANTTDGDIHAGTATPLINAASTTEEGATIKYLVTATSERPTSTDGFSADVPTAEAITAPGTYYVWYYLDFATSDDSDISAQAIEVTVADYLNYTVIMANGTDDAGKWTIEPTEATTTGVKPGTEIKATYSGTKRVKSVKAVKKAAAAPKAAAEATAEDKGKLIGTDGNIYADVEAATAAGTTAVAKIIYIGTEGHDTYTHGLALALNDEANTMAWQAAINACSAKNTSTPVTNATWLLASKEQWDYMITAAGSGTTLRDGFSGISGASNLQDIYYLSSTAYYQPGLVWSYDFDEDEWGSVAEGADNYVRACLAF